MFNAVDPAEEPQDEGLVAKMARLVGGRPRRGPALLDSWMGPAESAAPEQPSALLDAFSKASSKLSEFIPGSPVGMRQVKRQRLEQQAGLRGMDGPSVFANEYSDQQLRDQVAEDALRASRTPPIMTAGPANPETYVPNSATALDVLKAAPEMALNSAARGRGGLSMALADLNSDPFARKEVERNLAGLTRRMESMTAPMSEDTKSVANAVSGGVEQLGYALPGLVATQGRSLPAQLASLFTTMAVPSAGKAYPEYRRAGLDPLQSAMFSGLQGAQEAGTELLPMGWLARAPLPALKQVLKADPRALGQLLTYHLGAQAAEFGQEYPSTALQWVIDKASGDPTATADRFMKDMAETTQQIPIQGGVQSGGMQLIRGLTRLPAMMGSRNSRAANAFADILGGTDLAPASSGDVLNILNAATTFEAPNQGAANAPQQVVQQPGPLPQRRGAGVELQADRTDRQLPPSDIGGGGEASLGNRVPGAAGVAQTALTDRAQFLYEPSQGLSDEERAIEQRFAQSIGTDIDRAVANYEKANTQNGTLVINTDQARDLSEDYNRDIESRSLYAAAVHEPASALVKKVWRAALDRPPAPGKEANVIFTAGGTGAGKTTAIDNVPAIAQLRDASDIIYDGNLNNFDKAVQRIEEALASGRTADIVYVYRDPVEAMRNGALPRAERQGRTVRIDAHADSHIGSLKVVGQLMERYKGDPRVNIVVLDNSHGPGGAVETTIDRLPAWEYDALVQELINVVQADYEAGRISDRVYRGTLGQRASIPRGAEPRLQEGDPGKPQPQRTRQPEEAAGPVDRALGVFGHEELYEDTGEDGAAPKAGQPFLAYRVGTNGLLEGRNAGSAQGVAAFLADADDFTGPTPTAKGTHLYAYRVVSDNDVGRYAAYNMGRTTRESFGVGRAIRHGGATYSFAPSGGYSYEVIGKIPMSEVRRALKGAGFEDFDDTGSIEGGKFIHKLFSEPVDRALGVAEVPKHVRGWVRDYQAARHHGNLALARKLKANIDGEITRLGLTSAEAYGEAPEAKTGIDRGQTIVVDGERRPTTNNLGKPIHPTTEGIANFWRWFGDSKVVDAEGKPLVVYHGTSANFAQFNTAPDREMGAHFGSRKQSEGIQQKENSRTLPVYLHIQNPYEAQVDLGIWGSVDAWKEYLTEWEANGNGPLNPSRRRIAHLSSMAEVRSLLESKGFDGISYFNRVEGDTEADGGNGEQAFIAFHPEQIKSATGNTGKFSAEDDRIIGVGDRQVGLFEEGGHRVASTGRVYGAPPSARTSAGLKRLRERLWKLTNEGATGRHWYEKTGKAVLDAAEGDADVAEKIVGLLAIYSAGSELRGNTTMAMKAYYEWVRDGEVVTKSRIGQNVADRANSWMKGESDAVTGVKRSTFYQNMMRVIAPERFGAEDMGATIDMWMARAFGYDSIKIGAETQHGRYAFAEKEIKRVARQLGWEPQQVQAAIWVAIKARSDEVYTAVRDRAVEKGWLVKRSRPNRYGKDTVAYVRSSPEGEAKFERALLNAALKSGTPSAERIADSALDYADTLADRTAQISWEALPSTKSDVLPGIHAAPLAQQAEYLAAIDQSLRDKNGQDEIAKLVGLAGANTVFGFSGWEGKVGEGAQTKTFVATDRPPVKDAATGKTRVGEVVVTDQARSVINLYAAIRGQLLHQDAVAWHFPVYEASLKSSNGVEIRAPGGLTHDQAQALYNEINKLAGHTDYAPIYTETGVRFLNFRDMPNREFHKLIEEAYNIVTNLPGAEFGYFRSDGELISKDKEVSSNGQDYQEVIAAARRPDLQNRIEVLRDRVASVEARFAEKYGWDKAAGEEARADRAQGVEQRAFYGRDAIDSLEVGRNKSDHPTARYGRPFSMGVRSNVHTPDDNHRQMLNAAAHDIEAAGFPLAAAMQAVKGVVTYNGNYSHWNAAWLPDHRVVAFSEMRLIEMEGSDARQRYLRGWLAHELTHAIDDAGNGSISSGSPRLDFFVAGDTIVTKGDVVTEVAEAYAKGGKIGEFFEYPLAYAKEFAPALMKEELLAQLSRLYTTNKELMRRELPVSFKMMEDWYAQIQPDSLAATRAGLQAALRAPGSGLGGQERQLHGVDQAVSRADRGVLGVGGAGAGVATGGRAAGGGQGAVAGKQPDLFQSAYSGEKYAANLNLDRYDTAGAIKGLIEATAKNITDKSSRGETATHDKTLAEADRLGISEDQVLAEARKGGKPMSLPEARAYALAVRQLIVTRAEATKHFAETAFKSGSSQDRAEAMASLYHLAALQAVGMNLSAEAGRLLNSYRILAGVTTGDRMSDAVFDEERQKTAEQVLEQMFGGTNNVDDILARVALMSTQQLASPKMRKALLSRRPSAFLEIWKAGLLSGPQTHIVNMASNALTALIRAPETAVAAAIGKLHGGDKVYFRETAALMAGMTAGTITGARDAWQIIRHGEDTNDAGKSETTGKAITGENFGLTGKTGKAVDIAGEVVRTPFRALAAEDAIFKGINRTGTLYALAYRQAIKEGAKNVSMRARELVANPTREMMKAALEDGLYFTFNNQLGAAGQKTLDVLHSTKAGKLAQFAVVPFFRTPVNILKFGIHRSPLAPLTQKFQEDIKAGGAKRDMAVARMMTGTAIMTAAFSMAAAGLLTGGGEPDKERKAADRIAGWRPYSVRLGNKFLEYRRLEPLGMLLGMAVDIYELSDYMTREESDHWIKMAGMAFAQNITSKTFLTGLTNLMKAMSEPEQYGDNYLGAMTGSFVPGVVGQAARARDPWERDTDPDKNLKGLAYAWDDVKRDIQARIPGQREKLPLRRDALGQPMPLTDSPSMFNPIRTGELRTDDPVAMELANARARVSPAKGVIQNVKLTPEEKEAYGRASGTVTRGRLERLFASPAYQGLPQFLRDEKISKEMEKARTDVRNAIVGQMPAERRVEAKIRQLRR